jgi:DNA mismatch repair protein MutS
MIAAAVVRHAAAVANNIRIKMIAGGDLMAEITPMMKQYFEIKKQYADTILLFRLGDFYEMFFDDAKLASRELELVLTGRDWGQEERAPMCGVPFHSADSYIARLVANGHKVAICEQTEDPALAKGLVSRNVVRVLTPGTVIESSMLEEGRNNYLACVYVNADKAGICFADVSTGSLHLTLLSSPGLLNKVINELGHYMPAEVICNNDVSLLKKLREFFSNRSSTVVEMLDESCFDFEKSSVAVLMQFKAESLDELGLADSTHAVSALGCVLNYLSEVQKSDLENMTNLDFYNDTQFMRLDVVARQNLELVETIRNREKKGSLLWVLDKTKTPMGKRLIRTWLEQPIINLTRIIKRHNAVSELLSNNVLRQDEMGFLSGVHDVERLMARVVYGTANARELVALASTIKCLPQIRNPLVSCKSALLSGVYIEIDILEDVQKTIEDAIVEEPPFIVREGGMIKEGFNTELDSLREISNNGKAYIASIQTKEQEKTGIKKLKIGYNRVFGYYIEIPNSFKDSAPEGYIRKQTLANCERYITQELKELESKVLGAQERIVKLEYELFEAVRKQVALQYSRIQKTAAALALLDTLCSLAQVAAANNYVCPEMSSGTEIQIRDGRHPVVELMLDGAPFVPNDTNLDCLNNRCAIITGPNMAGKSTYMRQVALITLMAQMGSFVPASMARIGIVDCIFTRIGASDDLSAGKSTFMVEMSEVASILEHATGNSLIIFDEIGRGTSTFDGMSIARAVLEYTADKKKLGSKTLFATHYHELTELENQVEGVKNYNIAVKKRGDEITFLRRIVRGGADGSYGIEVAKLAGIPHTVVNRAKIILKDLESAEINSSVRKNAPASNVLEETQVSFNANAGIDILAKIKDIDVNTLTPIEALTVLFELVKEAGSL